MTTPLETEKASRMEKLSEWLRAEFGEVGAAKRESFLYQPNFNLGGERPIDTAIASDCGFKTVQHMMKPISGC